MGNVKLRKVVLGLCVLRPRPISSISWNLVNKNLETALPNQPLFHWSNQKPSLAWPFCFPMLIKVWHKVKESLQLKRFLNFFVFTIFKVRCSTDSNVGFFSFHDKKRCLVYLFFVVWVHFKSKSCKFFVCNPRFVYHVEVGEVIQWFHPAYS